MHIIRAARHDKQLTLREVSERTGVPLSTIADWETGAHVPRPATAVKVCEELGVPVSAILADYGLVTRGEGVTV